MIKDTPIAYKDIPLFENIESDRLPAILGCLRSFVRSYSRGETILMEENQVRYVGIVLSGTVHMMKEDIWGDSTLLAYMCEGDLFGEIFAVQKETASYVTFTAASDVTVLYLSVSNIIHNCEHRCAMHARLTQNMFDLIGRKSVQLMEKIEVSSKSTLRGKILAYLSMLAQKQGSRYITVPLSRTELASFLSANRSAMTRELAAMQEEGLIEFDRNTFVLKKEKTE